ncbi:DUF1613-domain-containing protein [Massarina eburnea CBS 473.64]|uniref:tRNA (uracil-O(2)-)-methyltransferase n=1 Tax=Massarina eburnea CBS 473.64 TaxID=1395130 RepID=A0A6A6RXX5_9PLEO|nr:DUF1613-domain-containing protein [Massarina eburnea CBS 473.64]
MEGDQEFENSAPVDNVIEHDSNPKSPKHGSKSKGKTNTLPNLSGDKFEPMDLTVTPPLQSGLPPEIWTIVQSTPANFPPQYFLEVSRNLLENPNLTATYLSRAELSYTSFADATYNAGATHPHELASIVKHMKADHQPRLIPGGIPGYQLEWTVVRKLIPRNPKLDEALLQTCHLFTSTTPIPVGEEEKEIQAERYLVFYLPHVTDPESIPFYHPKVRGLAILYTYYPTPAVSGTAPGTLSLYYDLFPQRPLDNRMERTALKMLEIIHKHAKGRMQGYQKRVHHDIIIPQKTFQDTYADLKGKYAQDLIARWVEQTPPEKHVFEDLGIAAFLIELWTDMYSNASTTTKNDTTHNTPETTDTTPPPTAIQGSQDRRKAAQAAFPGFVDIGCGNGILVYILHAEGWHGWGFDARKRKTWAVFPDSQKPDLRELLLIPSVLDSSPSSPITASETPTPSHPGTFPPHTFIISNHADELTPWTPLLAHLSSSPFIAIPCCSHDFAGTRFRAPYHSEYFPPPPNTKTGKGGGGGKQVSAYTSLCSYVAYLTKTMGYVPEKEYLRIPSTRNIAVVGRKGLGGGEGGEGLEERVKLVRGVVEKEMGGETTIEQVRLQWVARGSGLMKPGKGGH